MNFILFDSEVRNALLPFTFTKPVAELRFGILTFRERWEKFLNTKTSTLTEDYLAIKYPLKLNDENVFIDASFCPNKQLIDVIFSLKEKQAISCQQKMVAYKASAATSNFDDFEIITFDENLLKVNTTWDLFSLNAKAIQQDFELVTKGRISQPIPTTVQTINPEHIFIEEGALLNFAILNASSGPIYIGKNAEVMEGSVVRGALALCEGAALKLATKIYGATTIGPHSKVGGEVNNSILMGYSNKGHDGFLGNSVLGEWCNLGADTNNSNLKNNYAEVKLWDYNKERFLNTGLQFCGLMMGDHSKCGINTMFNTGTVVGVSANIFGSGFPRNFVPSFSWGGASGFTTFQLPKVFEVATQVMKRRNLEFDEVEQQILTHVFELTKKYRKE